MSLITQNSNVNRTLLDRFKEGVTVTIFGKPLSGKSSMSETFPKPYLINTDGNFKTWKHPYSFIGSTDGYVLNGEKVSNWDYLKAVITELETVTHDFKTIVVDLIEDVFEYCRVDYLTKNKIESESDIPFGKAYTDIRNNFLHMINRLKNLCSSKKMNIVFLSHQAIKNEVVQKDEVANEVYCTNINSKIENKLLGLSQLVIRTDLLQTKDKKTIHVAFLNEFNSIAKDRLGLNFNSPIEPTYASLLDVVKEHDNSNK